jgi:hypothetical protein
MGIITMGLIEDEDEEPEDHFTPFRFVSSQAVAPILHVSSEARRVGLKHYKRWFTVEYDFRSFAFSTPPHIYYNNVADRVCFHGYYIEGSNKEIWACIRGYEAKRLAINVNNIDQGGNIADGTRGIELVCDIFGWYHEGMDEIAIFSSSLQINKGEGFHFVEVDSANMAREEREKLIRAKTKMEIHMGDLERSRKSYLASRRRKLIERCKEEGKSVPEDTPSPEELIAWKHPVIKFVSLVRDPAPSDL